MKDSVLRLRDAGIGLEDANALRRISMTLQRWHELECGDSNDYASWAIVRGRKEAGEFIHDDDGRPFEERHIHRGNAKAIYTAVADREAGAKKRLKAIMARYPEFAAYVQTDPRGCALYLVRKADVPAGEEMMCHYTKGIAVHK
jgi:hypothetical protein